MGQGRKLIGVKTAIFSVNAINYGALIYSEISSRGLVCVFVKLTGEIFAVENFTGDRSIAVLSERLPQRTVNGSIIPCLGIIDS